MSELDELLAAAMSGFEHRQLGNGSYKLHLMSVCMHVTLPTPGRGLLTGVISAAAVGTDPDSAHARCCSELAERLVGSSPAIFARHAKARAAAGSTVMPWQHLTPHRRARLNELNRGLGNGPARWCHGAGLVSGHTYAIPAAKVFPAWQMLTGDEHDYGECDASGLAAGLPGDVRACRERALHEVLERDALMLAWRLPSWARAEVDEELVGEAVAGFARENRLRLSLHDVGDPCLVKVVLCLLSTQTGGLACGSACAATVGDAARRAALEAVAIWNGLRDRPPALATGAPVRTSRDHVGWAWTHAGAVRSWFQALPLRKPGEPVAFDALVDRCHRRFFGAEPVVVDLAGEVDALGGRYVCRILQPHAMRKEWEAGRPFLGGRRLAAARADAEEINVRPHPFG